MTSNDVTRRDNNAHETITESNELTPTNETYLSTSLPNLHREYDESSEYADYFLDLFPLTLETVEKLLQREDTQAYLDSFTDETQKKVVKTHLQFCPYTNLCNFSFLRFLPSGFTSSCDSCSCELDCDLKNDCCPDILDFNNFSKGTFKSQVECMAMSLKKSPSALTVDVVSKCPEYSKYHELCEEEFYKTVEEIVPVTDKTNNVTYKNKYCAFCHQSGTENLVFWSPTVECEQNEKTQIVYKTEKDLISSVLQSSSCDIKYTLNNAEDVDTTSCIPVIDTCNITGRWASFDPFLMSACLFYENIYWISSGQGATLTGYR